MVAEKLSTKVLKNWIMLWKRARARSVAKIRPITASGPLLTHHLLLKANLPARMEIIRYLLVFTGIYQKRFLVVKTPFWTEPWRESWDTQSSQLQMAETEPLLCLIPNRNLEGQVKEGTCLSVGEGEKAYFFFSHTPFQMLKLWSCAEPKRPPKVSWKMQMLFLPLPKLWTRVSRCAPRGQWASAQ